MRTQWDTPNHNPGSNAPDQMAGGIRVRATYLHKYFFLIRHLSNILSILLLIGEYIQTRNNTVIVDYQLLKHEHSLDLKMIVPGLVY